MNRHDAREVAESIDLAALATELLGSPKGKGRSAKWPSPVPGHPQTGATPPMGIFVGDDGRQRWKCFATGESGDAIDLIRVVDQVDFQTALERASARAQSPNRRKRGMSPRPITGAPRALARPAELERFVNDCAAALTSGHPWLAAHGFDLRTARHYGIGRAEGMRAPTLQFPISDGFVLPVLDRSGELIGADIRSFGNAKYLKVRTTLEDGLNYVLPERRVRGDIIGLTEGSIDAYAFAHHVGVPTIGVASASIASQQIAEHIARAAIGRTVVLGFDDDAAGNQAADILAQHLPRVARLDLQGGDVGDAVADGMRLVRRVRHLVPPPDNEPIAGLGL